jgi:hypothetical protein
LSAVPCRSGVASPLLAPCAKPQGAFCVPPSIVQGSIPTGARTG